MFVKSEIAAIQTEISAAMKAIAEKHGLKLTKGLITYGDDDFRASYVFANMEATGGIDPKYIKDFKRNAYKYGLTGKLNTVFGYGGKSYTLVGLQGSKVVVKTAENKLASLPSTHVPTFNFVE